jgi:hypothetical protein
VATAGIHDRVPGVIVLDNLKELRFLFKPLPYKYASACFETNQDVFDIPTHYNEI